MFIAGAMLTKPAHAFSALQALLMADRGLASRTSSTPTSSSTARRRRPAAGAAAARRAPRRRRAPRPAGAHGALAEPDGARRGVAAVADDIEVHAKHVVLAVPPILISRISFEPPLPRRQQQLHQHLSMGFVIKVHAVYETPFWRDAGLSGTAFSPYELVHEAYDNTNHGDPRGTLVGFVSDEDADSVFSLAPRSARQRILESLSHYYGEQALHPVVYYESDWGCEEWTRGAYAASFDMGGLARYGADLRTPVGPDPLLVQRHGRQGLPARRRRDPRRSRGRRRDPGRSAQGGCRVARFVVGYTANDAGADALALGDPARAARARRCSTS